MGHRARPELAALWLIAIPSQNGRASAGAFRFRRFGKSRWLCAAYLRLVDGAATARRAFDAAPFGSADGGTTIRRVLNK